MCPAATNFKVCQDAFSQPEGRVFLVWNNEASYSSHCIFVDGRLEAELPGFANLISIPGLESGPHTFAIQSHCGASLPSLLSEIPMEVQADPPTEDPVQSMRGRLDPEQGAFVVELRALDPDFESVDIFVQDMNLFPTFLKCQRLEAVPDQDLVIPEITQDQTRVFLQFFDKSCHGSRSLECLNPSRNTPPPGPPTGLQVFQTSYPTADVETVDVILCWLRDDAQKGFEILVDGIPRGTVGALLDTFFLGGITAGEHHFEVRTIPWERERLQGATATVTLLPRSPIPRPVGSIQADFRPGGPLRCSEQPRRGTFHVSWVLEEDSDVQLVDVMVRRGGEQTARFVTTTLADQLEIAIPEVFEDEEVALQFFRGEDFGPHGFSEEFFGSPVFDGGSFRRGDSNQDGGVDISDAIAVLDFLFSGGVAMDCRDAADANDDKEIDISDGMFILNFLFSGGSAAPPAPGHLDCGLDMTEDELPRCMGTCAEP